MKANIQKTSFEKKERGSNPSGGHQRLKHGSLFSGIGGFDLAAQWAGWENVFHCEFNEFGKKILNYYWPNAISYHDITKTDFTIHKGSIDILTGGFPCQPFSTAGKREGTADSRHLWPEMLRAIREIQPTWIVGENVYGFVNWNNGLVFEQVQVDLENEGYEVQSYLLPAASVNAPHRRDRIFIVAHAKLRSNGLQRKKWMDMDREILEGSKRKKETIRLDNINKNATNTNCNGFKWINSKNEIITSKDGINAFSNTIKSSNDGNATNTNCIGIESCKQKTWKRTRKEQSSSNGISRKIFCNTKSIRQEYSIQNRELERGKFEWASERNTWHSFPTQSPICDGNDGISTKLDGITFPKWRNESIKAGGNAIVPQVAFNIFSAINAYVGKHSVHIS